jgi:hypothetical protein
MAPNMNKVMPVGSPPTEMNSALFLLAYREWRGKNTAAPMPAPRMAED